MEKANRLAKIAAEDATLRGMAASTLRSAGPGSVCPNCLTPGARPGEHCSGCRLRLELDACALEAWQGHGTCAFVARRSDGTLVAVSPAFSSDDCEEPEATPSTSAAREELVAALDAQGWRLVGGRKKGPWYSARLERLVALVGPELEVPAVVAVTAPDAPAPEPPARPRRRPGGKLVPAMSIAGLAVAGVLAYAILAAGSNKHTRLVTLPAQAASAPAKTAAKTPKAKAKPKPDAPAPTRTARLAVTATRTSWLELRRGSSTGRIVYSGELPAGRSLHVRAPRIWARFGAAANLEIVLDGKRLPLQGTLERVFTAT